MLDPRRLDPRDPRPYATVRQLRSGVETYRGRGARAAASAIEHVREGVESRPETRLRLLLVRAGLPEPEVGVDIYDDAGKWLGRADQLFREWKARPRPARRRLARLSLDLSQIDPFLAGWVDS